MNGFLSASSLHGLQYLSPENTKSRCLRLFWFICILVSFSLAISMTGLNLVGWSENPDVVTAVDAVDIENNALLPVVVLCPSKIDISNFISTYVNLINTTKTPKLVKARDELNIRIMQSKLLSTVVPLIENSQSISLVHEATKVMLVKISEACQLDEMSYQCQLFTLLYHYSHLKVQSGSESSWNDSVTEDKIYKSLALEVAGSVYTQEALNLAKLRSILLYELEQRHANVEFVEPKNWTKDEALNVYKLYMILVNSKELVHLANQGIWPQSHVLASPIPQDGIISAMAPELKAQNFGTYLSLYYNRNFQDIRQEVDNLMTAHLNNDLQFSSSNYFNFFDMNIIDGGHTPDCVKNTTLKRTLKEFCQQTQADCQEYCEFIEKSNEKPGDIVEIMSSVYPSTGQADETKLITYFPFCSYQEGDIMTNCAEKVATEHGMCYAVNKPKWDPAAEAFSGQKPFLDHSGNWMRIFHETFGLRSEENTAQEFLVYVSDPSSLVQLSSDVTTLKLDSDHYFQLKVKISSSTEGTQTFKNMPSSRRKCFYHHEKKLQKFDFYSDENCFLECLWDHAIVECDCVPWYIYNLYPGYKICERIGLSCFSQMLKHKRIDRNVRYPPKLSNAQEAWVQECSKNCFPDCERINYDILNQNMGPVNVSSKYPIILQNYTEYFQHSVMNSNLMHVDQYQAYLESSPQSPSQNIQFAPRLLEIEFEKGMIRITKTATITTINMISNIGGTLGLFSGFSILSAIELIYWACVYLANLKKS